MKTRGELDPKELKRIRQPKEGPTSSLTRDCDFGKRTKISISMVTHKNIMTTNGFDVKQNCDTHT